MLLTRRHRFDMVKNQLTQPFHCNYRDFFCWHSRLSQLYLGPKRWHLFSPSQYRLYNIDGVKRGFSCVLLIRVLFYSIQEYTSWLMNRTVSCTACVECWSSSEGWIVRWVMLVGSSPSMTYPLVIFHPWVKHLRKSNRGIFYFIFKRLLVYVLPVNCLFTQ